MSSLFRKSVTLNTSACCSESKRPLCSCSGTSALSMVLNRRGFTLDRVPQDRVRNPEMSICALPVSSSQRREKCAVSSHTFWWRSTKQVVESSVESRRRPEDPPFFALNISASNQVWHYRHDITSGHGVRGVLKPKKLDFPGIKHPDLPCFCGPQSVWRENVAALDVPNFVGPKESTYNSETNQFSGVWML